MTDGTGHGVPGQVPHLLGGPGSAGVLAAGGEQDAPAGQVHPRAAAAQGCCVITAWLV